MKLSTFAGWSLAGAFTIAFAASPVAQRAVPRGSSGGGGQGGGSSQPSAPPPSGARAPSGSGGSSAPAQPQSSGSSRSSSNDSGSPSVPYGRPREGNATGVATLRTGPPPHPGFPGGPIYYPPIYYPPGYYPWGYGGFGFGAYYGYGFSLGFGYGYGYGYPGFYDPWFYYGYGRDYTMGYADDGSLRLKIKPNDASVFVDGYFAGQVDEFDGTFQKLHVEPGPHRVEIRSEGFEPLFFDVRILRDRTVTFSGELKRF